MMTRLLIAAFVAVLAAPAFAEPSANSSDNEHKGFISSLSAEQRECIAAKNCPKPQRPGNDAATPDSDNQAALECIKSAFDECGIAMPERVPHPDDETVPEK